MNIEGILTDILAPTYEVADRLDADEEVTRWRETFEPQCRQTLAALLTRKPGSVEHAEAQRQECYARGVSTAHRAVLSARRGKDSARGLEVAARLAFLSAETIDRMLKAYARLVNPYSPDEGPTIHSMMQEKRREPMTVLLGAGAIDFEHYVAAREIEWIIRATTADVDTAVSRIVSAGRIGRKSGRAPSSMPEAAAVLHATLFRPWAEALRRRGVRVTALLQVIVWGEEASGLVRHPGFVERLRDALDAYIRLRQQVVA